MEAIISYVLSIVTVNGFHPFRFERLLEQDSLRGFNDEIRQRLGR